MATSSSLPPPAAPAPSSETETSTHKTVQELAMNNEDIPERYIYKDCEGLTDASPQSQGIPVIDLSLLTPSTTTGEEELAKLRSALTSWGCFQVINHGIEDRFLDKVRETAKQFFGLPMEEKKKYSRAPDDVQGYGNDMVLSDNQILDWTDRLYLLVNPEDQRNLKLWPENPPHFRETLEEYSNKAKLIAEALLKALAWSLNLEQDCFLNQCGDRGKTVARFNFYPTCPRPDLVLGLKPHADGSVITILLQDKQVEGLQFLKDNHWTSVPINPGTLIVNIGDQLEIMSNGEFKSPVHRAVVNSTMERISLASFYIPTQDREIKPEPGLISKDKPRLYNSAKNYTDIYFQNYQQGKRPIDSVRI